jgi:hypothetical protein
VQSQISIPVTLGDTARSWYISFSDGGLPYTIADGTLAKLEIRRPTGTRMEAFCAIENNTTVRYSFSQNNYTAVVDGIHDCAIVLYDDEGNKIATPRFTMIVSERVIDTDNSNLSDEDRTAIDAIISAESARQNAETARQNAEALRLNAETERVSKESARVTAESGRVSSESARVTAEAERATAESLRDTAEKARASAETARAEAETARVNAENDRKTAFDEHLNKNSLPAVTESDNGKAMIVENGKWAVGTAESGTSIDGCSVAVDLNRSTYVMDITLKDKNGKVISKDSVDFPLESMVVGGDEQNGTVTLTLQNGNTISFYIGDIVEGLTSKQKHEEDVDRINQRIDNLLNTMPDEYEGEVSKMIKFYIDENPYQAEYGMTWVAWCKSKYNTDGFYQENPDDVIYASNGYVIMHGNSSPLGPGEIHAGFHYYTSEGGVVLNKFYIDGAEYQAEQGMTWVAWCKSKYNTDGFYQENPDEFIYASNGDTVMYGSSSPFGPAEIYPNGGYYTSEGGKHLIFFIIDGKEYRAVYGETWGDWCYSKYNTDGFYCPDGDAVKIYDRYNCEVKHDSATVLTIFEPLEGYSYYTEGKISFTIAGKTYTAKEGMTWTVWVDTVYNTGGFTCDGLDCLAKDSIGRNIVYISDGTNMKVWGDHVILGGDVFDIE